MSHLSTTKVCPECRAPLPTDRLNGLCPACFLASAAELDDSGPGDLSRLRVPGLVVGKELARGGMGIVYAAEQEVPRRPVALKILLPQWVGDEVVRERFRREAHAMAELEHEGILPVFAVGETDGLPWFTMKLATGGSLAERLPEFAEKWARAAELVACMTGALSFAHERGVLHRDVKPGNILFGADGRAFLADFGLAKQQADTALTLNANVLGTPAYLAPELAGGRSRSATTGSDIYSLGAVLYELLTGQPPHRDESLTALLRRVADEAPRSLGEFTPAPPRDLRAICDKAMERAPEHRYATAREMGDDLTCFLRGEAVRARQAGAGELLWRWCRQHPAVASLLALVAILLAALVLGSTLAAVRIRGAERDAVAARGRAEAHLRKSLLAEAEGVRRARLPRFRAHALDRVRAASAPGESAEMRLERRSEAIATLAFPEMQQCPMPEPPPGCAIATIAPGHGFVAWLAPLGEGWRVTRAKDGAVISETSARGIPTHVSRDGRWLAARLEKKDRWQLWDLALPVARLEAELPGSAADLSEDGKLVAYYFSSAPGGMVAEVRETAGGRVRFQLKFPQVSLKMRLSGDGTLCAVAPSSYLNAKTFPYSVRLHRCADGGVERELSSGMANCIWSLAWSRDGDFLAASERGGATCIWDARTGNARHTIRGTGASMWQMAFSEDGRHLATVSDDRLLTIFDLVGGQPVARGGAWVSNRVPLMSWSTADPWVFGPVAVDERDTLIVARPGVFSTFAAPDSHGGALGIAIAPDGRALAVGDSRNARLWNLAGGLSRQTFAAGLWNSFAFSPDGRWLFGAGEPGVARWQLGPEGVVEGSRAQLLPGGLHNAVALDAAGAVLAAEDSGARAVGLFSEPMSKNPVRRDFATSGTPWLALSHDGARLAAAGRGGLRVWRVADGTVIFEQKQPAHWVSFSANGRWLLAGRERYEVLDAADGALARSLPTKPIEPENARASFTADGRWLATGHAFGRIALWDAADWSQLAILESPNRQPVGRFVFDAEGARLFSTSTSGVIEVWDILKLRTALKAHALDW